MRVLEKLSVTIRLYSRIDFISTCNTRKLCLSAGKCQHEAGGAFKGTFLLVEVIGDRQCPGAIHNGRMSARREYARCRGSCHSCPAREERNCGDAAINVEYTPLGQLHSAASEQAHQVVPLPAA